MNYFKKLFEQSSYYFVSNVLVMMAGLISFPIWTRIFTKAEYGVFSLVCITISIGVGFSKFGLQHAALRYHSDFKEKIINLDMSYYYTTLFVGSLLISGMITSFTILIIEIFLSSYIDKSLLELLPLIVFLVFLGSVTSVLTMFIRADNRGKLYSVLTITKRYGQLGFALIVVFYFMRNIDGLFLGFAFSEVIIFIILLSLFLGKMNITRISLPFLKEAIKYSFPLIWVELSNMILNFGDRYIIQFYMGSASVGIYSVGYNISSMAQSFLAFPLRLAILPMYLQIWNRKGEEKTKEFLSHSLNYYFMLGIPIIIGMSWFGKEIITLLATSKFQESAIIIPYIILPIVLQGAYVIYGAGLYIFKKTKILMHIALLSGVINLLLNSILIPKFGILGAAYATLISYVLLISLIIKHSNKYIKIKIQYIKLLEYILMSFFVVFLISQFKTTNIIEMVMKFLLGIVLYLVGVFVIDKNINRKIISLIKK